MADRTSTVRLTVVDNFSQPLDEFKAKTDNAADATAKLGDSTKEASTKTESLSQNVGFSSKDLLAATGVIVGFGVAAKATFDATVGATVNYAKEVRGLSQSFSITAEEASKLLQVGDDLGISSDTLKTAFRAMAQNGIAPSLDAIKSLGQQYRDIQDPALRAEFALKNFGRAGLELSPILLASASAIDASAESAQKAGQVMSQQGVDSARAYEVAVDDLSDSWQGLTYTIGQKALPATVEMINALNDGISKQQEAVKVSMQYSDSLYEQHRLQILLGNSAGTTAASLSRMSEAQADLGKRMWDGVPAVTATIEANDRLDARAGSLETTQDRLAAATTKAKNAAKDQGDASKILADNLNAAAAAQDALKSSQDSWLGGAANQAEQALKDAGVSAQQYADGLKAIDDVFDTHKGKDEQQQKDIDDLTKKYHDGVIGIEAYNSGLADIEAVYMPKAAGAFDLGKEHLLEFGTKGLDPIQNKLIRDTPAAFLTGSNAATQFGAELKKQTGLDSGMYVYGVGVQSLTANINALSAAIRNVPELALPNSGPYGGAPLTGKAGGGPVAGGQTYLVGENGPELFTPSTGGNITPNGGGGGGSFTINLVTNSGALLGSVRAEARANGYDLVQLN